MYAGARAGIPRLDRFFHGRGRSIWLAWLLLALASALPGGVLAQESGQTWFYRLGDATPPWSSGGNEGPTQHQALATARATDGAYSHVTELRQQVLTETEVYQTYGIPSEISEPQPWRYFGLESTPHASEQELLDSLKATYDNRSLSQGCTPNTTLRPHGTWFLVAAWNDGLPQNEQTVVYIDYVRNRNGAGCALTDDLVAPVRIRDRCSHAYVVWRGGTNCVPAADYLIQLRSKPLYCDKCTGVGNPIDFSTGDKYQTEPDLDLGWVRFARHYHSAGASATSGLGPGWSHSHDTALAISANTPTTIGLIRSDGSHLPFRDLGGAHEAVDGSGNRVTASGTDWLLHSADRTLRFDATGALLEDRGDDGQTLHYEYDSLGRLATIRHSTGRSLVLAYDGTNAVAPLVSVSSAGQVLVAYTHAPQGQVQTATYADGGVRTYHYEDSRFPTHLTGVSVEDGQRLSTFAYDGQGRAIGSQHAGGANATTLAYTAQGGAIATDALGRTTDYGLATGGNADKPRKPGNSTDSLGTVSRTYYDDSVDFRRRLHTVTDRNGEQTVHHYWEGQEYGAPVQVHAIQNPLSGSDLRKMSVISATLDTNRVVAVDRAYQRREIVRNARQQPQQLREQDLLRGWVRTTAYTYCEAADVAANGSQCPILGLPKSIDGPRTDASDLVRFEYYGSDDATCAATPALCSYRKGDLRRTIDPLGRATEVLGYDPHGRPLSILDPNGVVTDLEYHPRGWLAARKVRGADDTVETDDRITTFDYWPTGQVRRVTEPDGAWTEYDYDPAQRLVAIRDNAGNTIDYTLDLAGNRLAEDTSDAGGTLRRTLSRVYDQLGRLVTQADAAANPTDFAYDANGNLTATTDALGRVTSQAYDPLNRLVQTLQDVGGIEAGTTFQYDALDQLTRVVDPKGLATDYAYSTLGDLLQLDSPDTGLTSYTYDSAGNRIGQVDARGQATHYGYDALNRLTAIQYPGAVDLDVSYVYDLAQPACQAGETYAVGRLSAMADASGSTQYCYDRFGDLVRKVQVTNGQTFTLGYAYTAGGRLSALTYPDGTVADYVRDAQGRVTEIGVTAPGGTREVLLTGTTYAPFGPATGWTYGNGRSLLRSHDLDYRPQAIHDPASGGLDLGYGYDPVGQLQTLHTADLAQPPRARFDHDALGRLTAFRDGAANTAIETYAYDATGNRTGFANAAGPQAYAYPADSHRLTAVAGQARTYDEVGNTLTDGSGRSHVYSAANRLARVDQGGTARRHYVYNGKGERVRSHLGTDDLATVYDEAGRWLGDYAPDGTPKQQAIWLGDLPVGLLAQDATNRLHYVQPDHLGTPRAVIDPVRNVAVWTWDLASEAFGNSPPHQDPDNDGTAFVLDLRFPGQRYDAASGLNYNYFRDYEPGVGRYAQSDPIGLAGGLSAFAYVSSNPFHTADPLGLSPEIRGSWINPPRINISGAGVDGANLMPARWSWWGYIKFIRVRGYAEGYINIDVRCETILDNCNPPNSWDMHLKVNVNQAVAVDFGPNLYATLIGSRGGLMGAIGANMALGGGAALQAEHKLLSGIQQKSGHLIREIMENGPTAFCLLSANAK